jgi:hypothetical protein
LITDTPLFNDSSIFHYSSWDVSAAGKSMSSYKTNRLQKTLVKRGKLQGMEGYQKGKVGRTADVI